MRKSDVTCPECNAGYRRIEVNSGKRTTGGFSVRVTLYGKADEKTADRAIKSVQREKRRHFHLTE
jgi:hypothetical protein